MPTDDIPSVEGVSREESEQTGLPVLSSWRHVYLFVFGCFVLSVLLLLLLTMVYS